VPATEVTSRQMACFASRNPDQAHELLHALSASVRLCCVGRVSAAPHSGPVADPISVRKRPERSTRHCPQRNLRPAISVATAEIGFVSLLLSRDDAGRTGICNSGGEAVRGFRALALYDFSLDLVGSGCVLSQSARAAAVGSMPTFCHHATSSPQWWTSR
jgi:hypothetical protein